jgi:hypothetical protein
MFDRYPGDNKTKLPDDEKMYLDEHRHLTIPTINLFSMLVAENTKSVCKLFLGKNGREVALGITTFCTIEPFEIPICDEKGPITFADFNDKVRVVKHVARLNKGVPNPKSRPLIELPWSIAGTITYTENPYCPYQTLRDCFIKGGIIGLGTFRQHFGKFRLARFETVAESESGFDIEKPVDDTEEAPAVKKT